MTPASRLFPLAGRLRCVIEPRSACTARWDARDIYRPDDAVDAWAKAEAFLFG